MKSVSLFSVGRLLFLLLLIWACGSGALLAQSLSSASVASADADRDGRTQPSNDVSGTPSRSRATTAEAGSDLTGQPPVAEASGDTQTQDGAEQPGTSLSTPGPGAEIDTEQAGQDGRSLDPSTLGSLRALDQALLSKERQVAEVQQRLVDAQDQVTREDLAARLRDLRAELAKDRRQFDRFALEIDLSPFVEEEDRPFDWQQELSNLLKPILAELKNATADSRAIGELRAELEIVGERKTQASLAVQRLHALLEQDPSEALRARLEERLTEWQRLADEASNRYTALDLQLQNKLEARESLLDETTDYAREFVQTRGLNLLLALAAFGLVFFGVRWLAAQIARLSKPKADKQFSSRLALLLLHAFSVLGGLLAMMAVFNAAGDWFMLGIIIIFLLGVGWAGLHTLPSQVESVKLILNIGTVREGERLLFNEVPYRVDSLAFRAKLVNPELEGGVQELPVRDLVGHHSRPAGEDEQWFPTQRGDWVEMDDGLLGQVRHQSPSAVRLTDLGGAELIYPTADFLRQHPRRLGAGFRLVEQFGIDYQHQAIATTQVPELMEAALTERLPALLDDGQLQTVSVVFAGAGASSLDYRVEARFNGAAAPRIELIRATIHRILVDTCTRQGWTIPFPQLMLHRAGSEQA